MASRRHERRKQCLGKVCHETEADAEYAARKGQGKGWQVFPYLCSCCGGWHVGHPSGSKWISTAVHFRRGSVKW